MTPYAQSLLAYIRPECQASFAYEYRRYAKDPVLAQTLTVLLGVVGGESYYFGNWRRGVLMSLAVFTGIGLFITVPMWIVRCFTITADCENYNDYLAYSLAYRYMGGAMPAPEPPQAAAPGTSAGPRPTIGGLPMRRMQRI
ncbi:MAG: hypothetical protein KGN02_14385 [bacterium]|nr:hypothetical protein [bacterium]